jgi:hypothetical protein
LDLEILEHLLFLEDPFYLDILEDQKALWVPDFLEVQFYLDILEDHLRVQLFPGILLVLENLGVLNLEILLVLVVLEVQFFLFQEDLLVPLDLELF